MALAAEQASRQGQAGDETEAGISGREEDEALEYNEGGAGRKRKKPLHAKVERMQQAQNNRGIVYISRIPPHMKPQKLRQMLSLHGEIGRLYLAPEDPALRKKRKHAGKDTGKNFTEGWVEFEDKAVAKQVATVLNGNPMGGKRRSAYHFDLWCLKYLPKFKWDHLTEEITYLKSVREQKMAAEISAAKRERDFYLGQVDRAKGQAAMEERRKRQALRKDSLHNHTRSDSEHATAADCGPAVAKGSAQGTEGGMRVLRAFRQRQTKAPGGDGPRAVSADVLALIAGAKGQHAA